MLRSVLYMPASNARALLKARTSLSSVCDGFIFDLEEATSVHLKDQARDNAIQVLNSKFESEKCFKFVRINHASTEWYDSDLEMVVQNYTKMNAVLLPKVESAQEILDVKARLPNDSRVWAMIETPRAFLSLEDIASSADGLVAGTVDLANDLRADPSSRAPVLWHLSSIVTHARAANIPCLDGVCVNLSNDEFFHEQALEGRALGFDGKTLIHPKTIDACNKAFSPTEEEVAHAEKVIKTHEESDSGVVVVDGKLVEQLHVRNAYRILEVHSRVCAAAAAAAGVTA